MNYTLHQLQVFLKIAKTSSITKAAEELHLTQPAVSIQFKNFQEQFEIPLVEIIGRQLHVTDFGLEIAEAAENIINEVQAINYKSSSFKGHLTGKLRISVVSTGKYIMPYFLSDFLKENKDVQLDMDVTNRSLVIESLEKNQVDFSLLSLDPERLKTNNLPLLENKLHLVASPSIHSEDELLSRSVFNDLPLIHREKGSGTRLVMERFLQQNNLPFKTKLELKSNEAVKQAVIAGLGYSIMPLIGIKNELQNGQLKVVNVKGFPLTSTWNLVWLSQKKFSPVANKFLEFMTEHKDKIIRNKFQWFEDFRP